MELRHIRYFCMVAQEMHFGRAAKRLFISQPPLSRQIKELEEELGLLLFSREQKQIRLTEAGQYYYMQCQELLHQLEHINRKTKQIHDSMAGELKLGYISSLDKSQLGRIIHDLQNQYPLLQTKIFELPTEKQIQALDEGALDLGIIRAPNTSKHLLAHHLYQDGFCLALPDYLSNIKNIEELEHQPFISYHEEYAPVYQQLLKAFCAQIGFEPKLRHQCNTISSILELVHLGAGFSVVPLSVQHQYSHLNIHFTSPSESNLKTDILLVEPKENRHPASSILSQAILSGFIDG